MTVLTLLIIKCEVKCEKIELIQLDSLSRCTTAKLTEGCLTCLNGSVIVNAATMKQVSVIVFKITIVATTTITTLRGDFTKVNSSVIAVLSVDLNMNVVSFTGRYSDCATNCQSVAIALFTGYYSVIVVAIIFD